MCTTLLTYRSAANEAFVVQFSIAGLKQKQLTHVASVLWCQQAQPGSDKLPPAIAMIRTRPIILRLTHLCAMYLTQSLERIFSSLPLLPLRPGN